jgi:hypothetical protein
MLREDSRGRSGRHRHRRPGVRSGTRVEVELGRSLGMALGIALGIVGGMRIWLGMVVLGGRTLVLVTHLTAHQCRIP